MLRKENYQSRRIVSDNVGGEEKHQAGSVEERGGNFTDYFK